MGKSPTSDAGQRCNGGSADLDVYITPLEPGLHGYWEPYGCGTSAGFIVLSHSATTADLAHEFMHPLQATYLLNCRADFEYLDEAVATWAENHLYRGAAHWAARLITQPERAWEQGGAAAGYFGWPVIYSILRVPNSAGSADAGSMLRSLYAAGAAGISARESLNNAVPGGFDDHWTRFSLRAWNRPLAPGALTESFFSSSWEGWSVKPAVAKTAVALYGNSTLKTLPVRLVGPGKQYYDLDISDRSARYVRYEPVPGFSTFLAYRLANGDWHGDYVKWPDAQEFCRTAPEEDVRAIILVHSTPRPSLAAEIPVVDTEQARSGSPTLLLKRKCDEQRTEDSNPPYTARLSAGYSVQKTEPGGCGEQTFSEAAQVDGSWGIPQRLLPGPTFWQGDTALDSGSVSGGGSESATYCENGVLVTCKGALELLTLGDTGPAVRVMVDAEEGTVEVIAAFSTRCPGGPQGLIARGSLSAQEVGQRTITVPVAFEETSGTVTLTRTTDDGL